jgi:serine/threonine protein kinase
LKPGAVVRGSLQFIAPELFTETLPGTSKCDVYSFAVVLGELWTGTIAWLNAAHLIVGRVVNGVRPFSPDDMKGQGVPAPIIALIATCWAQNPRDRPTFSDLRVLEANFHRLEEERWPIFLHRRPEGE